MPSSPHPSGMPAPDQLEQWLARMELVVHGIEQRLAEHSAQPWHTSFTPMQADVLKRLDRMENTFLGVAKWMIGALFLIVGVLAAILGVAWRILETKPLGGG
jgi:hypothetical protein